MEVTAVTDKGGAVRLNSAHKVWASYAVAGVGNLPRSELFYAGVGLPDGRRINVFVNRETGLIVVDVIDADDNGGTEILRRNLGPQYLSDEQSVYANAMFQRMELPDSNWIKRHWRKRPSVLSYLEKRGYTRADAELLATWLREQNTPQ